MRASLACLLVGACSALACQEREQPAPAESRAPFVAASVHPLEAFANRMLDGAVAVVCPLPAGVDPAGWQPARADLRLFNEAELVLLSGAGLESWVARASLPPSRTLDTARGFRDEWLGRELSTHSHGAGGEHTHGGTDPHVWLDPVLAGRQAQAVRDALVARYSGEQVAIDRGHRWIENRLEALEKELHRHSERLAGVTLLASQPVYDYAARRFGWQLVNLDLDADAPFDSRAVRQVEDALEVATRALLLWETEPLAATEETLRTEYGLRGVVFDPGANRSAAQRAEGVDWFELQDRNLSRLAAVLDGL